MTSSAEKEPPKTSLRYFKYTLVYILLIPFINWSFTWAPMVELPGLADDCDGTRSCCERFRPARNRA